jgi:hypothetical protein
VNQQSVEFVVWLGVAVLALIWASLGLWRTRRVMNRIQQSQAAGVSRSVAPAAAELRGSVTT